MQKKKEGRIESQKASEWIMFLILIVAMLPLELNKMQACHKWNKVLTNPQRAQEKNLERVQGKSQDKKAARVQNSLL